MSTILKISIEQYDAWIAKGTFVGLDQRVELIHGELRNMSPAGPLHDHIIRLLNRWSHAHTDVGKVFLWVQSGLEFNEGSSVPELDIFWSDANAARTSRPNTDDTLLVIEVADSSLSYDLGEKMALYAAARIPEYWVVNIPEQQIHVFRNSDGKCFASEQIARSGDTISAQFDASAKLNPGDLFE